MILKDIYYKSTAVALAGMMTFTLVGCGAEEGPEVPEVTSAEIVEETTTAPPELPEVVEEEPLSELVFDVATFDAIATVNNDQYFDRDPIRGLYVSGHVAGISSWLDSLIEIADKTEVNAFVIDVKADDGRITYDMDHPIVDEISADSNYIRDIEGVMDKLYEHDIFPIARIVTFKDPYLAKNKPEYAIKNNDGSLWYYDNVPWLNPYNRDTWDYVLDVAKDAAKKGFKEIQFDYIRFAAAHSLKNADFGDHNTEADREAIIHEFVAYAMEELEPYGVEVSADVFGTIITSEVDARMIGQDYVDMGRTLDILCPMVYPSHYGRGYYGLPSSEPPDLHPYTIIKGSMEDSNEVLQVIENPEDMPIVRPWLQAFTASYLGSGNYMSYGKAALRDQMQGAYDAGLEEWLLWDAAVTYDIGWFEPAIKEESND